MQPIRLFIVDDHSLFRESLSRHFDAERNFAVVGQYASIGELLSGSSDDQADLILLDYELGCEQGCSRLPELRRCLPDTKILMVTAGMPDAAARNAMENGASGIFLKHGGLDSLLDAIVRVTNGEVWIDPVIAASIFRTGGEPTDKNPALTVWQREVLRGILDGLTNKEIAWNAKASEAAVKAVIQELFRKAGVRSRSQLVRIAIERHSSDWLSTGTTK